MYISFFFYFGWLLVVLLSGLAVLERRERNGYETSLEWLRSSRRHRGELEWKDGSVELLFSRRWALRLQLLRLELELRLETNWLSRRDERRYWTDWLCWNECWRWWTGLNDGSRPLVFRARWIGDTVLVSIDTLPVFVGTEFVIDITTTRWRPRNHW